MANPVVQIIETHNGELTNDNDWHYIDTICGGSADLCSGEYFGYGQSAVKYKTKSGKITCPLCIDRIKKFQSIKL